MRNYYKEMSDGGMQREDGYAATLGSWIQLTTKGFDYQNEDGWKFKVSVAHDDVPKAWNIIADVLLKSPFPQSATVVTPKRLDQMKAEHSDQKTISIDTLRTSGAGYVRNMLMFNEIDKKLREAGVRPASPPANERAVGNSPYLSYGWDIPTRGIYNPEVADKSEYNPSTQNDPYVDFKVEGEAKKPERAPVKRELPPMLPEDSPEKEFLRFEWRDAATGTRLPLEGMEAQRAQRIMKELMQEGLHPTFAHSEEFDGLAIYLKGDDAKKFREIHPGTPLFLKKEWQGAQDTKGQKIARLPIGDMSNSEFIQIVLGLQRAGFTPTERMSDTLGKTIRLTGKDAERLETMKSQLKPLF